MRISRIGIIFGAIKIKYDKWQSYLKGYKNGTRSKGRCIMDGGGLLFAVIGLFIAGKWIKTRVIAGKENAIIKRALGKDTYRDIIKTYSA